MEVTIDYYKELEIDRAWDCSKIRKHLNQLQKVWVARQNTCNVADGETIALITERLGEIKEAQRYLIREEKRKKYDIELDKCYKDGIITDKVDEQLYGILEQARDCYKQGKFRDSGKLAQQAVEEHLHDPEAYRILADSYFQLGYNTEGVIIADRGIKLFPDNLDLMWLGTRIMIDGIEDYDEAQRRINKLFETAPDDSYGPSEQVYLHLRKGETALAYQEIDEYLAERPDDEMLRFRIAYNIYVFSNSCFHYDKDLNCIYWDEQEQYDYCLELQIKAYEICSNEFFNRTLADTRAYGEKEWNDWNLPSIRSLSIYGALFMYFFFPIGILLLAVDALVIYYSYRPYWLINKTHVTGRMGKTEELVSTIGRVSARAGEWLFGIVRTVIWGTLKFVWHLATGHFFG